MTRSEIPVKVADFSTVKLLRSGGMLLGVISHQGWGQDRWWLRANAIRPNEFAIP